MTMTLYKLNRDKPISDLRQSFTNLKFEETSIYKIKPQSLSTSIFRFLSKQPLSIPDRIQTCFGSIYIYIYIYTHTHIHTITYIQWEPRKPKPDYSNFS